MWVEYLKIENFRIIEKAELSLTPGLNIIHGGNAHGKTTILRALKVLVGGENRFSVECLRFNKDFFLLKGELTKDDGVKSEVIVSYSGQQTRRVVDGKEKSGSETRKTFPLISLDNESSYLIKGEPSYRRKFLDELILYLKPHYSFLKAAYYRALHQRMRALTDFNYSSKEHFELYLDELEKAMSQQGAKIIKYRREAVEKLKRKIKALKREAILKDLVDFDYLTVGEGEEDEIKMIIKERLFKSRQLDREKGRTSCGPHLDELKVFLGEKTAREFASEGEQKIVACLLYLAASQVIAEETGEHPVLIIDDFPAVLDEKSSARLINFLKQEGQVILTVTAQETGRLKVLDSDGDVRFFRVEEGEVKSGTY